MEITDKLDTVQNEVDDKINFLLDVGQGRSYAKISYDQVLKNIEKAHQEDDS